MNVINFENNHCKKIRSYLDSFINDELLVETNHEVLKHLESCQECAEAMETRVRVKNHLQKAVRRDVAPEDLKARIQREIRKRAAYTWPRWTLAAAAAVVLIVATWGMVQLVNRQSAPPAEATVAASSHNAEILRIGLGDHIHCALDAGFARRRFSFEEMQQRMGPDFIGLVPLLKEKVPADYEVVVAHRCFANKREFQHVLLKNGDRVLSLVVTRKNGENFSQSDLAVVLDAGGVPIYQTQMPDEARAQQLEVAGFESRDYLAFVISNAAKEENLQIASSLAPAVRDFLAKREA